MNWPDIYLFCFCAGFLFSLISVLLGHLHLDVHGHHGHLPHVGSGHHGGAPHSHGAAHAGHPDAGRPEVSPFSVSTAAAFLAWFGGTGYLATHYYRVWFLTALVLATAAGLLGASVVFWFLAKVLMRDREDLDPANFDMIGVFANVSCNIRPGGVGEILFSQAGSRRAAPARSEDGSAISSGAEVIVTRFENGIAYVRRWDELSELDEGDCKSAT
jgi:membrane protein implicated in regulation of membrane protease activity